MGAYAFDHYQRYHWIRQAMRLISGDERLRILEVGAVESPLKEFLPEHSFCFLDETASERIDLRGNANSLPFCDGTFDGVISTDTLEHIKPEERAEFILELQRVTRQVLILGFPYHSSLNQSADEILFDFIKANTNLEYQYLKEHLENRLPDKEEVERCLKTSMAQVVAFENANIYSWLLLQLQQFLLSKQSEFEPHKQMLNNFFNEYFEQGSHTPPCYRTFLIGFKRPPDPIILQKLSRMSQEQNHPSTEQFTEASYALTMSYHHALQKARWLAEEKDSELKNLREEIRIKEQQLHTQAKRIRNLQDYLDLFLKHPVYKLYKALKAVIHKPEESNGHFSTYEAYWKAHEPNAESLKKQRTESQSWQTKPLLSVVTAVYDPPLRIFRETVQSVLSQTYAHWVWNIVDASTDNEIWRYLSRLASEDSRIRPVKLPDNGGISANTNVALKYAEGDYVVMLDHDDTLAPFAFYSVAEVVRANADVDFIYSDSDKLNEDGIRCEPLLKPDWSPEMMLSFNLLAHLAVFRTSLLKEVGLFNASLEGAQDWDLYMRMAVRSHRIQHIQAILYHWRKTPYSMSQSPSNKQNVIEAQRTALLSHLLNSGVTEPQVQFHTDPPGTSPFPFATWKLKETPLVSIVIPSRDHLHVLGPCLESLFSLTKYPRFEVILVDTGSVDPATWSYYQRYLQDKRFSLIQYKESFNFGRASNVGASKASGDLLLFLNNDIQVLHDDWLDLMVQWFSFPGVGIVGAKLLYPDFRIQHGGAIVGLGGLAAHLFQGKEERLSSIFGRDCWYRNLSAVTGACLLILRELFESIHGFDESFVLNYSDVDLCLKAREAGYRIVYTPHARLIHHESATHRRQVPRSDFVRASERFQKYLNQGDPYFNRNLSYDNSFPQFTADTAATPRLMNHRLMSRLPDKSLIVLPEDLA